VSKILKIGIIGAGRIAKVHAANIVYHLPQAALKTVADPFWTAESKAWFEALGVTSLIADPEALLNDKSIDAVLICSSTDTHADFVIRAAKAGKHVFCEKPVDLTVAKVKAALQAAKDAKVKLQVGFNRRFDHNFKKVRDTVLSGAVGEPHIIKITSRDPAPPPAEYVAVSGGIFLDMTIHDFDMARFQAGSEVVEVFAAGSVLVDPAIGKAGDVDTSVITLKFASGAIGVIDNSRKAAYGYDQRLEVFGSKGVAVAGNDTPSTVKVATADGVAADKPLYFFLERYREAFVDELKAFVDAVQTDKPVPVTGEDGLQDLIVALAAKKSLQEGRPVKVSEIPLV
jgi:myo-inositol 2-dehydrogenase/D-chiro-inositol 1-dehydrogenase